MRLTRTCSEEQGEEKTEVFHCSDDARKSPNDPKLSDGGARRGSCVVERRKSIQTTEKGGSEE